MSKFVLLDSVLENKLDLKSKLKNVVVFVGLVTVAIVYMVSALISDENAVNLPTICGQVGFGGYTRRISDLAVVLVCLFAASILVLYSRIQNRKGFEVFLALSGKISVLKVGLNFSQLNRLNRKSESISKLLRNFTLANNAGLVIAVSFPLFILEKQTWSQFWLLFAAELIAVFMVLTYNKYVLPPMSHLYLVSLYLKTRIKNCRTQGRLVETVLQKRRTHGSIVERWLNSHNVLCRDIHGYNRFWSRFYLFALVFMIPYNLFVLHALLFGELDAYMLSANFSALVMSAVYVFAVGLLFAEIGFKMQRTKKQLNQFLVKYGGRISKERKIQLLDSLERIDCKRKVGFTCGTFYCVSYATVFNVSIFEKF